MYVCYMKKMLFLSLMAGLVMIACKKEKLGTKPVLTFKSYSGSQVFSSYGMDVTFEIKDGDGDIESTFHYASMFDQAANPLDTIFEERQMPNLEAHNGTNLTADVILHLTPTDFPQTGDNPIPRDSVHYLIYVVDNAGNFSDTIATSKIEVLYE